MRAVSLVACLIFVAATSVLAAPWSRLTISSPWKKPPAAAHEWVEERELGPYLIRSEFPLHDVHQLVQDLGDLQDDIEKTLKLRCQPQAIQIHLFNSKRSYNQYLSIRVPEGVNRRALYVPDTSGANVGRIYAYRDKELETDVRHETTHALLHTALPYVPIWIDEGFAEYFEVPAGRREKGNPHRAELQNAIRFERWKPNIANLESKKALLDMKKLEYRDSWGVVHFLIHGPQAAQECLAIYFEEIQSGDVPTPLSQTLRQRIPNLEQAIVDHLLK